MRFTPLTENPTIFRDAVETFGIQPQKWIAVEEMAELIKEISKNDRNGEILSTLSTCFIEEFIDVCICMAQMEYIIRQADKNADTTLEIMYGRKIRRLQDKIDEHSNIRGNGEEEP